MHYINFFCRKDSRIYLLFAENDKGLVWQGTATIERELPQGTIQDLVRGMTIFISKTGIEQTKLQEIQDFVNAYKLAQEIHALHAQLESAAHPDFQVYFAIIINVLTWYKRDKICAFLDMKKDP